MMQVQLHIEFTPNLSDYQRIDIFDDENISLKSSIQNIRDIGKVFADFTRTFNIPANKTNNKLFQHAYNPDVDGFNPLHKRKAKIYLNHMPFREGYIFLQNVKIKNQRPFMYTLIFYGGLVTLKDKLGDKKLESLFIGDTTFTHDYNSSTVKSAFQSGISSQKLIYPLITSLKRLYYDSAETLPNYDGNLYVGSTDRDLRGLSFLDLKPAIKVTEIISRIETKFNLSFTGFFSTTAIFDNLYLWLSRESGEISDYKNDNDTSQIIQLNNFTTSSTELNLVQVVDTTSDGNTDTFKFTTISGRSQGSAHSQIVTISGITPTTNNLTFRAIDKITGETIAEKSSQGQSSFSLQVSFLRGANIGNGKFKNFLARDYEMVYELEASGTTAFTAEIAHKIRSGGSGQANTSQSITYNAFSGSTGTTLGKLNIDKHFPDMKILDFITGLFKIFNLTAQVNEPIASTPVINVRTLDTFYNDASNNVSTGTIDITEFVDVSSHDVEPTKPFNRVSFEYEKSDALLMRQHFSNHNKEFGNTIFDVQDTQTRDLSGTAIGNESDRYSPIGREYKLQIPFSHLKYERIYDEATNAVTEIQWGYAAGGTFKHEQLTVNKGNYESKSLKPLLFYAIQQTISDGKPINFMDDSQSITQYFRPANHATVGDDNLPITASSAPNFSLNFDCEFDEWNRRNYCYFDENTEEFIDNSLFNKYYASYIRGAFNLQKRIFKFKAYLPAKFLTRYKLNDQLKIKDRLYRINSIETNLNTGESKLELLNLIPDVDTII